MKFVQQKSKDNTPNHLVIVIALTATNLVPAVHVSTDMDTVKPLMCTAERVVRQDI